MKRLAMVVCLSAVVGAQSDVPGPVRAERLVKQLELADKCPDAMYALWQLGADAVPALSRAVRDPRIEVVEAACAVICEMKDVATSVRTHLERESKQAKGRRKEVLVWALRAVNSQTIAVAGWSGEVVLLDRSGKVQAHHKGFGNLWGVQLLPDGNCLVAHNGDAGVSVIDAGGKVVKEVDSDGKHIDLGAGLRAQRLLNGHTLIAGNGAKVRELDRDGKPFWTHDVVATAAIRLLNGHTLMLNNSDKELVEVDREGKVVFSCEIPVMAYGLKRLPNGNTLVTTRSNHRLIEIDAKGNTVKSTKVASDPNDVLRYADGTMVIAGKEGVTAYDAGGKTLWTYELEWAGSLAR